MRTILVALTGSAIVAVLVHHARRYAVVDRLRYEATPPARSLPAALRGPLTRALDAAAVRASPEQAVQVWLLACTVSGLVGAGISVPTGMLGTTAVGLGAPIALYSARHRRARLVAAAVPDTLERIGSELRSGGTVATALESISRGEGALAIDLARIDTRVRLGASLADALHAWPAERPGAGIEAAAGALALSASVGGRAADALDGLASSLRDRLAVIAESRALSAQARYSAWVIGVAPIGYLACSGVFDPRSVHALLGTAAGRLCALVGLGLEVLGAAWMRAIVASADAA